VSASQEWWGASTLDGYPFALSDFSLYRPDADPHSDAHSSFTASKTVSRFAFIKISRLQVNVSFTETRRESAGPLARSSTELTRSSTTAKSSRLPAYQILISDRGRQLYRSLLHAAI
jgi:hypothetical protein